jgi:putative choline sulfate-utilization transcription factor
MSNSLPSLELLRVFESCARCHGFTAAAVELGMTQPAVSQQMQRLERELGNRLFERVHRGIVLTASGQALLAPVQQALDLVRDAVAVASAQPSRQLLSISTDFAFAAYWLMPRLARFYALHPNVDVSLVTSNRALSALAPDVDLAIAFGDGHLSRVRARLLFREAVFPVCSPQLLQRHAGDKAAVLRAEPLLHLKPAAGQPWFDWPSVLRSSDWAVGAGGDAAAFDNYTMVLGAAVAGQGVAIGWRHLVDDLLQQSLLCRLQEDALLSPYGYHLLTAQHKKLSASARTFVDWLLTEVPAPESGTVDSRHG